MWRDRHACEVVTRGIDGVRLYRNGNCGACRAAGGKTVRVRAMVDMRLVVVHRSRRQVGRGRRRRAVIDIAGDELRGPPATIMNVREEPFDGSNENTRERYQRARASDQESKRLSKTHRDGETYRMWARGAPVARN